MRTRMIQTGYLLGIASFLAAIIYFFAANWGGFSHFSKLSISSGLLIFLYGVSYLFAFMSKRNYLTHLLMFGGCLSFGVSAALVGQIYNSHADSYLLFLVWLVPALLFSVVTRKESYYVLSLLLLELTIWFYIFPTSAGFGTSEKELVLYLLAAGLLNGVITALTEFQLIRSNLVKIISYLVFQATLLILSNTLVFEEYGWMMNLIAVLALVGGLYYFLQHSVQKSYSIVTSLFASLYIISKYVELAVRHADEWFFLFGILFFLGLLLVNMKFLKYVNSLNEVKKEASPNEQTNWQQVEQNRAHGKLVGRTAGIGLTIASILIGCISIIGFIMLVFESEYVLLVISVMMIIAILLKPDLHAYLRYTFLAIGLALGIISTLIIDSVTINLCYVIFLAVVWALSLGKYERIMVYTTFIVNILVLFHNEWRFVTVIALSVILNLVLSIVARIAKEGRFTSYLKELSFFYLIGSLFWYTFLKEDSLLLYYGSNVLFFLLTTFCLFFYLKKQQTFFYVTSLIFWFLYLVYKYYDVFWSLLHKSLTLVIVSLLFFGVTYFVEQRGIAVISEQPSYVRTKAVPILIIILLQIGITGYQIGKSETILREGTEIKLQLAPIDPRSVLQGDYVRLNYEIAQTDQLPNHNEDDWSYGERVRVLLQPDSHGVYRLNRIYDPASAIEPTHVILNGKKNGNRIVYGIESYFIPEGTGLEVESRAKYALVRVGSNGDAILVSLLDESGNQILVNK